MKVQFEVEFDIANTFEQRFLAWFQTNEGSCKNLLLLGFMMIDNGMMTYYDEKYKQEIESIWSKKYDKVVLEKKGVEQTIEETLEQVRCMKNTYEQVYDSKYRTVYESELEQRERTNKNLQEENYALQLQHLYTIRNL
jgi:hypothetical protein